MEVRTLSAVAVAASCVLACARAAVADPPLNTLIPNLFGGQLSTSITPFVSDQGPDVQKPLVAEQFRGLSASLAAARSQVAVPSASGAFQFVWDSELDTFVRRRQSFGSLLAERAQTLGQGVTTLSITYSHVDFSTLDGEPLNNLTSIQPAFTPDYLAQLPERDRIIAEENSLETRLDLSFQYDLMFFTAAYGITDSIDVSLGLAVNQARMTGRAVALILDPAGNGGAFFTTDQQGVNEPPCGVDYLCARDEFSESVTGTGDIYLRGKWHFYDTAFADLAAVGVLTIPTGNADDFLGFNDPTFTPWLVASKTFGRISPHVNLGYAIRSGDDVSQALWIAGADLLALPRVTLAADFLGYHDDNRDGINDDIIQSAIELKLNPFGQTVFGVALQFPVNRAGLRADVIYTFQIESTF